MTHEELCERARRWLSGTRRCEPVFSNIASCSEIPDAIGWSSTWAWHGSTVVECKTSRSDFYADSRKYIGYRDEAAKWNVSIRVAEHRATRLGLIAVPLPRMGDFRFFMCERESGITAEMVEKHAPDHGLIYVKGARRVEIVRPAVRRDAALIDKDGEIRYLRFSIINRKEPFQMEIEPECAEVIL